MTKILIIDDSSLSRRMMKKILAKESYQVVEASDGYSALEVFSLESPDLVLLDLTMPGMNGFDVLKQLKDLKPSVKVIVATADIQSFTKKLAFEMGADGFITKPFDAEEVTLMIRNLSYVSN
jgi:two-component system chemotaxis response regulator CheY